MSSAEISVATLVQELEDESLTHHSIDEATLRKCANKTRRALYPLTKISVQVDGLSSVQVIRKVVSEPDRQTRRGVELDGEDHDARILYAW